MIVFEERVPSAAEQRAVAESVGWDDHFDWASLPASLHGSEHGVVAREGDRVVGVGRLVGDGVRYWYVQDVMVRPDAADQGIASGIVARLLARVRRVAPAEAIVGLFASPEAVGVYEELGFVVATDDPLGMTLTVEGEGAPARSRSTDAAAALGYDAAFLGEPVAAPAPAADAAAPVLPYVHFSVTMHLQRRLAWSVAWNVDGLRLQPGIARSSRFFLDDRLTDEQQTGEAVYRDNDLDRGHIARRADLLWGTVEEAKQANRDSFTFTNISPQLAGFNQSSRGGIWGELENGVLELDELVDRRISVFAGPVLADDDPWYRDLVQVPRDHWKVVVYKVADALRSKAFLLTQDLDGLRTAYLDAFRTYELSLAELAERTGLSFDGLPGADQPDTRQCPPREIIGLDDLRW
ncbi:DNA/RNA endonuclease G, NUC1 [Agrococcus baldri]|uniref:DNA/RNA endonuclease G, NUC1 n=1 Tax=Agrococcus baldri TaxID=153730 RepID=A0AA94HPM3_9MICO|nr:GNAT family N-acetyltransferase [Agrococcus baldri]SFS18149.1 DNA/RNA endonuclease G, NUC1 [Agrococcus baldri]